MRTRDQLVVPGLLLLVVVAGQQACVGGETTLSMEAGAMADGPTETDVDGGGDGPASEGAIEAAAPCTDASDTGADPKNCGQCGNVCPGSYACVSGKCGNEVVEVAAADSFACVVLAEGSVYCWGINDNGELGVEPSSADSMCQSHYCRATPTKIPGLPPVAHVAAGADHACAITTAGDLYCWGNNGIDSALAQPTTLSHSATPLKVTFPPQTFVAEASAGDDTTCVRTTNDDVYCWGENSTATAGVSPSTSTLFVTTPSLVGAFQSDVREVRVGNGPGNTHACAVRNGMDDVWCWGANDSYELGTTAKIGNECGGYCSSIPQLVPSVGAVSEMSVGASSTCALGSAGMVCWGTTAYGEFGSIMSLDTATPTQVTGVPNTLVRLTQGAWVQFGLTAAGNVYGWGSNDDGEIGGGTVGGASCQNGFFHCTPNVVQLPTLAGATQIAFKAGFGVALMGSGQVFSWGQNDYAQLGHVPNAPGSGDGSCAKTDICNPVAAAMTNLP